ncbi:DsbA family protein [Paenibacillus sp. J5C_2022]|uniref:DsbA family protein n=1 Tax=Paenibacillus sp. J5C2022 TaxID=2977129 RepID=UPI0021CF6842|nr:DsbA family protein [Paenibacillus sp. J5C2022]MCU6711395.1 DsbA family protein [Paenibacillus sp. J5C2022]
MNSKQMMCDLKTGLCGEAENDAMEMIDFEDPFEKATLYYVTDPICSHCWALEPVLRRLQLQYGHYFEFHTVMGGLLESWDGFGDAKNGISKPADVAGHWREVGEHSRMPIDGSLWLDNPIQSSYPASRVFKVVQQKDERLAHTFLRRAREAVFTFNRNIGERQVLGEIVKQLGLDSMEILSEADLPQSQNLLEQDFTLARRLGVRGFPTIVMMNAENKGVKIVGARSLDEYVHGLEQVLAHATELDPKPQPSISSLLTQEKLLFSRELEVLYDLEQSEVSSYIQAELSPEQYEWGEILGEVYIRAKE